MCRIGEEQRIPGLLTRFETVEAFAGRADAITDGTDQTDTLGLSELPRLVMCGAKTGCAACSGTKRWPSWLRAQGLK